MLTLRRSTAIRASRASVYFLCNLAQKYIVCSEDTQNPRMAQQSRI
jgi:hypothetical protein